MRIFTKLLIILLFTCTSCNSKTIDMEPIGEPRIIHLQDTYSDKYFLFENFQDNEIGIKYLFDFSKTTKGTLWILTHKDGAYFEDGYAILDTIYQRFVFYRTNNDNRDVSVKVNFKHSIKIDFIEKVEKKRMILSGLFEMLDLNVLQNMLDYIEADTNKSKHESFTYELYNKENIKKVVIVYHNHGEWFSIDTL